LRRQWWQICSESLSPSRLQIGVFFTSDRFVTSLWPSYGASLLLSRPQIGVVRVDSGGITKSLRNSVAKVLAVCITKSFVRRLLRNFVVKVLEFFVTKSFGRGLINSSSVDSSVLRRQRWQICSEGLLPSRVQIGVFQVRDITVAFVRCELITNSSADRSGSRRQWWHY